MNFIIRSVLLFFSILIVFSTCVKAQVYPQLKKAKNGKFGFIDKSLDWTIAPIFDKAFDFENGNARIILNSKWGLIDQNGKYIIKPDYSYVGWSDDPYYKLNSKNIGLTNTLLPAPPFFNTNKQGFFSVLENNKWALVQPGGKVFKFEWDSIITMNGGYAPVYKNGDGWSWIDRKGNAPKAKYFKEVYSLKNGLLSARVDSMWYAYGSDGTRLNISGFDSIENLNDQIASFSIFDKKGTLDQNGQVVKEPIFEDIKYDSWLNALQYKPYTPFLLKSLSHKVIDTLEFRVIGQFDNHLFLVVKSSKYQLWNMFNGKLWQCPKFDEIELFEDFLIFHKDKEFTIFDVRYGLFLSETFRRISKGGDFHFLQKSNDDWLVYENGNVSAKAFERYIYLPINNTYAKFYSGVWQVNHNIGAHTQAELIGARELNEISKGIILAEKADQLLLIHLDSLRAKTFILSEYQILGGGYWAIKKKNGFQIIDSLGNELGHEPAEIVKKYERGQFRIIHDGKWTLINSKGQKVLNGMYDFIGELHSNHRVITQGDKYGVINQNGHFTYPMESRYEEISDFTDRWATVKYKGLLGKIDVNGVFKIAPHYDAFGKMTTNLIEFKFRNQWGVLDLRENIVIQPVYDRVRILNDDFIQVWKNGQTGLINSNKELKIKIEFDSIIRNDSDFYLVYKAGKTGIYDLNGNQIRAPYFDEIKQLDDAFFALRKGDFWQVINNVGQSLMSVRLDAVFFNKRLQQFILKENRDWIIEKIPN